MRSNIFVALAVTLAVLLSGVPVPAGAGPAAPRTPDADNSFASATALTPGTAVPGTLDSTDDPADYYSAMIATPGQVFNVSVSVSAGKVRLVAYDPSTGLLEESNLGGQWESLSIQAVMMNAKYYFVVFINGGTVATYSILVGIETPAAISWSQNSGGNLVRASDNPADWYAFTLAGGQTNDIASFTILHDASVTIDVWIYDLWPNYITTVCNASIGIPNGGIISMAASNPAPYYLKVWASGGTGAYSVSMAAQQTMQGDNDYDFPYAHRLNNTAQPGSLDGAWDHYMFYKFYLDQNEQVKVRMDLTPSVPGKFWLIIYHGAYVMDLNTSNFVQGTGWTNTVTLTWTAQASTMFYLAALASEAIDASGKIVSGAAKADFSIRIEQPVPFNHAPVVASPPPDPTHIPEDSINLLLWYLRTIFEEPDGEQMTFKVTGSGNISLRLEILDASVFATTTPDWSGVEMITITATDTSGKSTVLNIHIQVDQVADPPVQIKPIENQTVMEDDTLIMDLSQYFTDADIPFVYQEHLEYRVYAMQPVVPTIYWSTDNTTQTLTFGPARNTNHQKEFYNTRLVTLRVSDKGPSTESHARQFTFNLTVIPINHAPFPKVPIIFLVIDEDGNDTTIKVDTKFDDYDIPLGDVLQFKAEPSEHINATIRPGYILEVRPQKNWHGQESFYITATDRDNSTASIEVNVTVNTVNDPPDITEWSPTIQDVIINETETLNLSVVAIDPDSNTSELTYTWLVNGQPQFGARSPKFTFTTGYESAGTYVIQVNVSDGDRNSTHAWNVLVYNINRKPTVEITSPLEGGVYPEGGMVRLSADASDPEFDPLTYTWKEGNTTLGRARNINYKFGAGAHNISILVDDGKDTTVKSVTFSIDTLPTVNITSPLDRKHFKTSDIINFSAIAYDRDGDTVSVQWRERTKSSYNVLASVANFTKKLGKGAHEIYINATDGRNSVETPTILIFVDEPKSNGTFLPGFELLALLAAIILAAAIGTIYWRKRGRGPA